MVKWKCSKHQVALREVEDYPGALVHDGCYDLFTVIDNHLCILDDNQWQDIKTGEYREIK